MQSRRAKHRRSVPAARSRRTGLAVALSVALAAVGLAAVALALSELRVERGAQPPIDEAAASSTGSAETSAGSHSAGVGAVEVPDVIGLRVAEAKIVLEAAGFEVTARALGKRKASVVRGQSPAPGTVSTEGSTVTLLAGVANQATRRAVPAPKTRWTVVIDAGHQERSDMTPEPVGPGSKTTKPSVTGGTTGATSGIPEYEVTLQIAMNLKARLEKQGVKVVMTRTTNDVNVSNSKRAAIANKAGADLFVRIHADGSPDGEMHGLSTLYPASNRWTRPTAARSKRAARLVHDRLVAKTGASDRGIVARSDLSGFNHARVPAVLVECGFMSNPVEDRLLTSPHYQDKLASGLAEGVLAFLGGKGE